ncbi:MAG: hypothetical protein AB1513_08870 [Pseudomonadota bacterium]
MAKKTYDVATAVEHDGKRYESGSKLALDDAAAAPLLAVLAIKDSVGTAPAPSGNVPPADEQERLAAVTAAIAGLDPANADLWLKDGRPKTEAIAAVTGWQVSAAERDAAWSALQG